MGESAPHSPFIWRLLRRMRFRHWRFGNRLTVMVLFFTLAPLVSYVAIAAQLFRRNAINAADAELRQTAKSLIMLCEAQEALDRLRKTAGTPAVDAVSGASPAWRDGDQYRSLRSIVSGVRVAQTGFAYAFDSSGQLVIHPTDEGSDVSTWHRDPAGIWATIRQRALNLPLGVIDLVRYDAVDPARPHSRPRARLESFGYFKPYDWIVVVGCWEDELTAPYADARRLFYLMIALTPLLVGAPVFFLSRRMMRPIVELTAAAARIATGDFQPVQPLGSRDEIGRLTGEFNAMVHKLQEDRIRKLMDSTKELEGRVAERTDDLQQAFAQMVAVEKLASLGKISTMVAHELNNPMSAILSYSVYCERLVEYGEFGEEAVRELRECLHTISLEAERCGKIVQNLLMFAKRSWGEFAEAPLRQIAERAAAVLDHSLKVNDIALERRYDEADDVLWCDPSGLEQLFIALIVNAVEAMEKGGRIVVAIDCTGADELRVTVSDNGRGIAPDLLPHVFDPFVSAKDAKSNVGLGLSVAYGIVQSHNGRIAVASRVGEGTTFEIALPRRGGRAGRIEESLTQLVAARRGAGG